MKYKLLIVLCLLKGITVQANNLQIGSVTLTSSNSNQYLNFKINWSNSWRTSSAPFNWDAVWVFVKRRDCAGLQWHHANVAGQDTAHSTNGSLFVDAYADKKGVMIYRNVDGSGTASDTIKLKLDSVPAGNYDYQVFGVEMVYVPQGAFYLGDGGSSNTFLMSPASPNINPYLVTNEQAIPIGTDSSKLFCTITGLVDGTTVPTEYPKGFNEFYCMKYEVSQGQYADFLNNITQDAFNNRNPASAGSFRHTIDGIWPQVQSSTPNRACNYLNFRDLAAYLDWSALSPMTELEFEKICRGSNNATVMGEKAWGTIAVIRSSTIAPGTDGTPNENVTDTIPPGTGIANCAVASFSFEGVLRCGFAAKPNANRYQAGATYYGVMEMSGNVAERCYNPAVVNFGLGLEGGAFFAGQHGDGELSVTPYAGFANQGWPHTAFAITNYEGYAVGTRGGSWLSSEPRLNVSDRSNVYSTDPVSPVRAYDYGGRGVSRRQQ